jgi:mRNA-capping enzyme
MKFISDHITYQGWDDPYVPRTHEGLLKWKYANLNSVDFLFEVIITFFCMVLGIYDITWSVV